TSGSRATAAAPATDTRAEPVSYVQPGGSSSVTVTSWAVASPMLVTSSCQRTGCPRYAGAASRSVLVIVSSGSAAETTTSSDGPAYSRPPPSGSEKYSVTVTVLVSSAVGAGLARVASYVKVTESPTAISSTVHVIVRPSLLRTPPPS